MSLLFRLSCRVRGRAVAEAEAESEEEEESWGVRVSRVYQNKPLKEKCNY